MSFTVDPEHTYINLSASASSSSTFLSTDPEAQFSEKRNASVITDASKYSLAVVRFDMNGCRNLPLFIPSILTGQDNPWLTTYNVVTYLNLTSPSSTSLPLPPPPGNTGLYSLCVKTYFRGAQTGGRVFSMPPGTSAVDCVAAMNAYYNGITTNPVYANLLVTLLPSTGLEFSDGSGALDGTLYSYTVQPWITSDFISNVNAFGFETLPPSSPPYNPELWTLTSDSKLVVTMPNIYGTLPGTPFQVGPVTTPVLWESQTIGSPVPQTPRYGQDDSTAYWTYDYQWITAMINKALLTSFQQLVLLAAAPPINFDITASAPYLVFNASSKTFTMFADASTTASVYNPDFGYQATGLAVGLNETLQNLLMFPAVYDLSGNALLNFSTAAFIPAGGSAPYVSPTNSWVALSNDFSPTASLWSPVGSIVFTTSFFPIRPELTSTPTIYGGGDIGAGSVSSTGQGISQVLSDVIPSVSDASDWRSGTILYAPTVLRWVDMPAGAFPIDTVDFKVGWRNARTGTLNPIRLNPLASFSVKILLKLKSALY